jgi:hypothetical protein
MTHLEHKVLGRWRIVDTRVTGRRHVVLPRSGSVRFRGDFARTENRTFVNGAERSGSVLSEFEREPDLLESRQAEGVDLKGGLGT